MKAWEYLLGKNTITRSIYVELCRCSARTAFSDLQDMVDKRLLKREEAGKKTTYRRSR